MTCGYPGIFLSFQPQHILFQFDLKDPDVSSAFSDYFMQILFNIELMEVVAFTM